MAAQFLAMVLVVMAMPGDHSPLTSLTQGAAAASLGWLLRLPLWWIPINLLFPPAVSTAAMLALPPWLFLGAFLALTGIYWTSYRTRVPLFLSSAGTIDALAGLLPADRPFRFVDLGCGTGTVLARLCQRFPLASFTGVEVAPLPLAIGWLRSLLTGSRYRMSRQDLWKCDLASHDVVYAFLSPVPMADLWRKAVTEMRPGTLFISNTFAVPGVTPDEVLERAGGRRPLYVWRMRGVD
jgi:SAM-dependent methyltransferase